MDPFVEKNKNAVKVKKEAKKAAPLFEALVRFRQYSSKKLNVQPVWLIHPRYRHLDRFARKQLMEREDREREAYQEERARLIREREEENAAATGAVGGVGQPTTSNQANLTWGPDGQPEPLMVISHSGSEEEVEFEEVLEFNEELWILDFNERVDFFDELERARQPKPELSTLLKYYQNLDIYHTFPTHVFTEEPEFVHPEQAPLLYPELECPVCKDLCFPPFVSCVNGHVLCSECKIRLIDRPGHLPPINGASKPSCPTCRDDSEFQWTPRHMLKLMDTVDFKCLHYQRGCDLILSGSKFMPHVKGECRFRPWKCPFCPELLDLEKAGLHMFQEHEDPNLGYADLYCSIPTRMNIPVPMRGEEVDVAFGLLHFHTPKLDRTFLLYQIKTDVLEYAWFLCMIGTPEESVAYRANLILEASYDMGYGCPKKSRQLEWKGIRVFSCQDEMRNIIEAVGKTYTDKEMPLHCFRYPGGKAERFEAKMTLEILDYNKAEVLEGSSN